MLKNIDTFFLSEIKSRLEKGYQELSDPTQTVLQILQDIGFISSRYWMLCQNDIDGETDFVLSSACGDPNLRSCYGIDLKIEECSIYKQKVKDNSNFNLKKVDVFQHTNEEIDNNPHLQEINQQLGINHKYFIHIPILCHGELHGQLSCSYSADTNEVNATIIEGLKIIGMMLGDYKLLHSQKKLSQAVDKFASEEEELVKKRDNHLTLHRITEVIKELMGAEHGSAFDYNWYKSELIKVVNLSGDKDKVKIRFFEESYSAGDYLTGKAFENKKYRYVHNIAKLKIRHRELINEESYNRHQPLIREDTRGGGCVVYGLLGQREHKSLIRMFNRSADYRIPFDRFETEAISRACDLFSKVYDDIITSSQLERIQFFTEKSSQNISNFSNICVATQSCLTDEWVFEIVVFGRLTSEIFTTVFTRKKKGFYKRNTQKESPFLEQCLYSKDICWVPISNKPEYATKDFTIESYLANRQYKGMIVLPNDFGNFKGGLGIPLRNEPRDKKDGFNFPALHIANIGAYSSIISRFMAFSQNTMALGKAQDFIGTIGHELKQPMKEIGQSQIILERAFNDIFENFPEARELSCEVNYFSDDEDDDELKYEYLPIEEVISKNLSELRHIIDSNNVTVDIASNIAQISDNVIELTMKPLDLWELTKKVANSILDEIDLLQGERKIRVKFNFNDRFKNLPKLIGDRFIITKIIENILRNAVKYSTPPGRGRPIEVNINANPQIGSHINILVSNWGMPINESNRENIFKPFKRGDISDEVMAKRGMGIGLYIARTFANSHQGNVSLLHSSSTYGDMQRKEKEGWSTEFEIRLSTQMTIGTFKYNIKNMTLTKS